MPDFTTIPDNCEECGSSPLRLEHEVEQQTNVRMDETGVGGEQSAAWAMPIGICLACGHRNRMMDRPEAGEKAHFVQLNVGALYASIAGARWVAVHPGSSLDDWNALENVTRLRCMVLEADLLEPVLRPVIMHMFDWMQGVLTANPAYQIHPAQTALIDAHIVTDIEMIARTVGQAAGPIRAALADAEQEARS